MVPGLVDQLNNGARTGPSEVLYTFTSAGGNDGSAFAGMGLQRSWINVMLGLEMLSARFMPIIGYAGYRRLAGQEGQGRESAGYPCPVTNGMFVFPAVFIVLPIGALSFFSGPGAWAPLPFPDDCVKEACRFMAIKRHDGPRGPRLVRRDFRFKTRPRSWCGFPPS